MSLNPHNHAAARRYAEHLRQAEQDDFWRRADAICARICVGVGKRLARSSTRFRAALGRRPRRTFPVL